MIKKENERIEAELDYVIRAMALVVEWHALTVFCESRSTCIGCPYRHKNMCGKVSTVSVLKSAAEIFRYFFEA